MDAAGCLSVSSTDGWSQTLSNGYNHSLAVKEDGRVVAWGGNSRGQCDVPSGLKAVAVSAGDRHSLALKEDGTVVAWGSYYYGYGLKEVLDGLKVVAGGRIATV